MTKLEEHIKKLIEVRNDIARDYSELEKVKQDIVREVIENELSKEMEIDRGALAKVLWAYEKNVDYEKLREEHPNLYKLGMEAHFNPKRMFDCIAEKNHTYFTEILRNYTSRDDKYILKTISKTKRKGGKKE